MGAAGVRARAPGSASLSGGCGRGRAVISALSQSSAQGVWLSIPEAKRTSRFLSGIINFIHFRDSCRETYMEFLWQYVSVQAFGVACQVSNDIYELLISFEMVVIGN